MAGKSTKVDALFANIVYRLDYPQNALSRIRTKFYWFSGISVGLVLLTSIASQCLSRRNILWFDPFVHSLFESYCGIISLIIAYVICREYRSSGRRSTLFLFLGFLSMGVFDFFHAYSNHDTTLFVWFHSLSAFSGASFFSWSALSAKRRTVDPPWLRRIFLSCGVSIPVASAAAILKLPPFLPEAVTSGQIHYSPLTLPVAWEFTTAVVVFNVLSAGCFLVSGVYFLRYFKSTNDVLYHVFSLSAFLLFLSELLFAFSKMWDPSWWYWHVIKLIIFAGLGIGLAHGFVRTFYDLHESRKKLAGLFDELKHAYENLKNAQEELIESERLASVGKLAATVAHEIRNPLGAIKNSAGIFKRHADLSGENRELLDIIEKEIDRLNRTIIDFLNFAKPSPIEKSPANLNDLIDETIALLTDHGKTDAKIKINRSYDRRVADMPVDRDAIKQCLWNILINALDAMPNGGTLTIATELRTREQGNGPCDEAVIVITDDGAGMSQETLSKVFQPFFSTKTKGTGLGLSIVKRIIGQHGGRVSISSFLGRGTQVELCIPCSGERAPSTANAHSDGGKEGPQTWRPY